MQQWLKKIDRKHTTRDLTRTMWRDDDVKVGALEMKRLCAVGKHTRRVPVLPVRRLRFKPQGGVERAPMADHVVTDGTKQTERQQTTTHTDDGYNVEPSSVPRSIQE